MSNWLTIERLFGALLVTTYVCNGLLALWAATSPQHWFRRCAIVPVVLLPLLLVPAYELWGILALQTCVVVAGVKISKWWKPSLRGVQFSLRTLLATAPLVAVVMVLVKHGPAYLAPLELGRGLTVGLNGMCAGCTVLLGTWAYASRRKRIVWPTAFVLCLALAAIMAWFDWLFVSVTFWCEWPPHHATPAMLKQFPSAPYPALAWFTILPAITTITWLMVRLRSGSRTASVIEEQQSRTIGQLSSRCIFGLLLLAVMVPPAATAWRLLCPTPLPKIPSPSPNGFHDVVDAAHDFSLASILGRMQDPQCSTEELAAEVAEHKWVYERLRLGLSRDVQVREWTKEGIANERKYRNAEAILDFDVPAAARALIREAELAQRQHRYGDAARIAVECISLGHAITHNALASDYNCALRVEIMGNLMLHQLLPRLDTLQCRRAIDALIEIDRQREPLKDVWRRDRIWYENSGDWLKQLVAVLVAVASTDDGEEPIAISERDAVTRLLIVELALRAYQTENGTLPDQLRQVTPEFLAALPVDPFDPCSGPVRYIRNGDQTIVYCVGPDHDNDGGRPCTPHRFGTLERTDEGDFRLDVHLVPNWETTGGDSAEDAEP